MIAVVSANPSIRDYLTLTMASTFLLKFIYFCQNGGHSLEQKKRNFWETVWMKSNFGDESIVPQQHNFFFLTKLVTVSIQSIHNFIFLFSSKEMPAKFELMCRAAKATMVAHYWRYCRHLDRCHWRRFLVLNRRLQHLLISSSTASAQYTIHHFQFFSFFFLLKDSYRDI